MTNKKTTGGSKGRPGQAFPGKSFSLKEVGAVQIDQEDPDLFIEMGTPLSKNIPTRRRLFPPGKRR